VITSDTYMNVQKCKRKELRPISGYSRVKRSRGHSVLSCLGDMVVIEFGLMGWGGLKSVLVFIVCFYCKVMDKIKFQNS
jgi:hypothetical protein